MANPAKLLDWSPIKILRDAAATIAAVAFFAPSATAVAGLISYKTGAGVGVIIATCIGVLLTTVSAGAAFVVGKEHAERHAYDVLFVSSVQLIERVGNHHRYTWTRELTIKSRRNELRLIPSNWYSTGQTSKPVQVEATQSGHAIFTSGVAEQDQAVHRWIYLGRPLAKGETVKVGIKWSHEDDVVALRPFMMESPRTRTKMLHFSLRFPSSERPKSVEVIEAPAWNLIKPPRPRPESGLECVTAVSGMVDYVFEMDNPKINRGIGLRWEW